MKANYVLVRAGRLRLVLPQEEVAAAQHVKEGEVPQDVVALSERMTPLALRPADRFVITRVRSGEREQAFAWDEARVLIDAELDLKPLPPVLYAPDAPIEGYVEIEGELALCTSAEGLLRWTHH
jgi:hypothetical protein